jgi:hypothetical protein
MLARDRSLLFVRSWLLICACLFMSPKVKKQAQDNPFYLTFGEIEGYANACL